MRRHFIPRRSAIRLALLIAASLNLASADTVRLSDGPSVDFRTGSDLYVRFSVWNYAANNRESSPYPNSIGLQLLGAQPSSSQLTSVPQSSDVYFAGYLFQGWLENLEGTVSAPFSTPDSERVGLPFGSLLLSPGLFGDNTPVAVIEADAALTLDLSERIFGPDVASRGSSAVIHLRNLGKDLQIGLGGGYSVLSAISEPSVRGAGSVTTSGITRGIEVTAVPEPGNLALLVIASLTALGFSFKRWRETAADLR